MTDSSHDAPHDPDNSASAESSSTAAGSPHEGTPFESTDDPSRDPYSHRTTSSFGDDAASDDAFSESQIAIEMAKEWVRQHQTAAMLGAFAVGAFVGALMRD